VREKQGFRELVAWQVGMDVVESTYRLTAEFPNEERYGLVSQMRRAAVSVPSNVAESQPVKTAKWTLRFINTAIGSSCELDTQLEVAVRLRLCTAVQASSLQDQIDRLQKLLYGMRRKKMQMLAGAGATASTLLVVLFRLV
jgi:four helix bundle protein